LSKYPEESCRNCVYANWLWSKNKYPEGRFRIIVQTKARCKANADSPKVASRWTKIDAREPFIDCDAWVFHNDKNKAQR